MAAADGLSGAPRIIEAVAKMRHQGLPFDVVAQIFVDPEKVRDELTVRSLVGEPPTVIGTCAVLVMAYYFPEWIGLSDGSEEE